jgi:hypothetical protein
MFWSFSILDEDVFDGSGREPVGLAGRFERKLERYKANTHHKYIGL